jgi:NAD(P)-binding Rossmann-like domain
MSSHCTKHYSLACGKPVFVLLLLWWAFLVVGSASAWVISSTGIIPPLWNLQQQIALSSSSLLYQHWHRRYHLFLSPPWSSVVLQYPFGRSQSNYGQNSQTTTGLLVLFASRNDLEETVLNPNHPSPHSHDYDYYYYDVIVVGAGISGVAAAHTLVQPGLSLLILESTDRVGGHLQSQHLPFVTDPNKYSKIDLGGASIHGKGTPLETWIETRQQQQQRRQQQRQPLSMEENLVTCTWGSSVYPGQDNAEWLALHSTQTDDEG